MPIPLQHLALSGSKDHMASVLRLRFPTGARRVPVLWLLTAESIHLTSILAGVGCTGVLASLPAGICCAKPPLGTVPFVDRAVSLQEQEQACSRNVSLPRTCMAWRLPCLWAVSSALRVAKPLATAHTGPPAASHQEPASSRSPGHWAPHSPVH